MAPKAKCELLARVNFPPYAVKMLTSRHLLVAGGGGKTRSGIANAFEIYELSFNGTRCCARPASRYLLGDSACMNCATWCNGKYHIVAAGLDGDCQIYQVKYKVIHSEEEVLGAHEGSSERRNSGNLRNRSNSNQTRKRKTSESSEKADKNSNSVLTTIGFEFQPSQRFQTDFPSKEEPFQKVVRISSDGQFLVTGGSDGHVRIWQYPELKQISDIDAHKNEVDDLDIHPSGTKVVSVSRDGHAYIWSLKDGQRVCELKWDPANGQKYRYRNCRFGITENDKKQTKLFTAHVPVVKQKNDPPCYLVKWEANKFIPERVQSVGQDLSSLAVSDDGRFVAIGTMSGNISIYIAFSLQRIYHVAEAHRIFVTGLQFLPSSEENLQIVGGHDASLVSISVDEQIKIHHIPKPATISIGLFCFIMFIILFATFTIMSYIGL